ncbi:MAG: hypothetical protein A2X49_08065 [Lentisphaerae bacterium GWF2_52_8]|nr:MAG: hypothetical protein A2X49_08065 [Lentisphaerae bacterium GWF2_52_8]
MMTDLGLGISDEFWTLVEPLIPQKARTRGKKYKRRPGGGRKPLNKRRVFEAILYVLKTGAKWQTLSIEGLENSSSVHLYFKTWESAGLFRRIWEKGLADHNEMKGIPWELEPIEHGSLEKKAPLPENKQGFNKVQWRPSIPRRRRSRGKHQQSFAISA